jgi:hypothetical protein
VGVLRKAMGGVKRPMVFFHLSGAGINSA